MGKEGEDWLCWLGIAERERLVAVSGAEKQGNWFIGI